MNLINDNQIRIDIVYILAKNGLTIEQAVSILDTVKSDLMCARLVDASDSITAKINRSRIEK